MHAALPQFAGARSLVATATRQPELAGAPFLSVRGGMGRFVERLVQELQGIDLRLRAPVHEIDRGDDGFRVRTGDTDVEADRVLVAIPAPLAAPILRDIAPTASEALARIGFGSSAVIQLRYESRAVGRPLDGAGYLVPREEGLGHAACTWVSAKWGHAGDVWLRAIVTSSPALEMDDAELQHRVQREVARVMRIS